jgi:hypothetical protein
MSTRELAKHIYFYSLNCKNDKNDPSNWDSKDDNQSINYISHLMELHFEPENHLGSKGFINTSTYSENYSENRFNVGC